MRIVSGSEVYSKICDASIVTIGNFDGVHRGHAEIFAHLKKQSAERGLPTVVVTFEPHPLKILAPEAAPLMITTFEQKAALIAAAGIDYLVVVPFSHEFSRVSPHDFVVTFLCRSLGMKHIIIGHDYAFGRRREGDFQTLEQLGGLHGFTLEDLPPIGDHGVVFSSSLARAAVVDGNMGAAARILGRYFMISGTVVHGREIGHSLGFPTANIATSNELLPPDGVYAVMAWINGELVKGSCNIGCNPTFSGTARSVEVFLLDFSGDLYGRTVSIQFVQRLRSEQKFPDVAALMDAIEKDVANTRIILDAVNTALLSGCDGLDNCANKN